MTDLTMKLHQSDYNEIMNRLGSAYVLLEEAIGRSRQIRTNDVTTCEFGAVFELMRDSKGEIFSCQMLLKNDRMEITDNDDSPESLPPTVEAVYDELVETETYLESCVKMYQDKIEAGSKNYPEARMNKRLLDFHVTELERIKADRQVLSKYF